MTNACALVSRRWQIRAVPPTALTLTSEGSARVGFRHTDRESYAYGAMFLDGQEQPGDLVLTTLYDYHLTDALARSRTPVVARGQPRHALLLLLALPGLALALTTLHDRVYDLGTWLALILGLSMAFWPLAAPVGQLCCACP